MTKDQPGNPFESPRNLEVSGQETYRKPGPLAMFGIVVVSIIAAVCTFFGTCLGISLGLHRAGVDDQMQFSFAYGGGVVLAILIGLAAYRLGIRRGLYRRHSSEKNHSHDNIS
ncbi:MAG: hypothetical protein P8K08_27305 [Fuerstiella sp.]|nr:hypothetical protein [Fuerstiella sp.]